MDYWNSYRVTLYRKYYGVLPRRLISFVLFFLEKIQPPTQNITDASRTVRLEVVPEEKLRAMKLLRDTVGEEVFRALGSGKMVAVKATNGMTYGVDIKGTIAKKTDSVLFDTPTERGRLISDTLQVEDCVASFYMWAKTNPNLLERRWQCGTITIEDKTKDE